ncbi:hypothetical protein GCM10011514_07220 [Emticicia aquatilis]|uniref:Uncharacterized protein n=1 Tax=Emticicia aquatilis TaxID=1537369 RepID=A0A916YI81_9BACT|nr:hypothetical protein GCM10011514_07220 [Emticicia aquatilis]
MIFSSSQTFFTPKVVATYTFLLIGCLNDTSDLSRKSELFMIIMAMKPKSQQHLLVIRCTSYDCVKIGVDVITGLLQAIGGLFSHPLTDIVLSIFLANYQKVNVRS